MDPTTRIEIIESIEAALGGGPAVAVATVTEGGDPPLAEPGAKLLVRRDGGAVGSLGEAALDTAVIRAAIEAMEAFPRIAVQTLFVGGTAAAAGNDPGAEAGGDPRIETRRHLAEPGDAEVMLQLFEAPSRLVIVGGGHIGLALAQIGELLGFTIEVLDDREAFANRERFPMAEAIHAGDMAAALDGMTLDATTYVVLVSRGHQQDETALRHSVGRGAAYVGMIGSRRRTSTVLRHLLEAGYDRDALEAVSTPIGLDIGAETPEEIALSVLAEIVMLRRGGTGERMRRRRAALPQGAEQADRDGGQPSPER